MKILSELWDNKLQDIITLYEKSRGIYSGILKKLRAIDSPKRDLILKEYYNGMKRKYKLNIDKWNIDNRAMKIVVSLL